LYGKHPRIESTNESPGAALEHLAGIRFPCFAGDEARRSVEQEVARGAMGATRSVGAVFRNPHS
jgi:hypothetical protein